MLLELDNVELTYGDRRILYGVYLKAETGKITGILGRNGCGKSSLLKVLFGSIPCNNRLIKIDNRPTLKKLYTIENIKYLPQHHFIPDHLKLYSLFKIFGCDWKQFAAKFALFEKYRNEKAKVLSGGEKRLVEIWLCLTAETKLCILDEPFTNLAPRYVEKIKEELKLQKNYKAIIVTDHLYEEILKVSDYKYILKNGCTKEFQDEQKLIKEYLS